MHDVEQARIGDWKVYFSGVEYVGPPIGEHGYFIDADTFHGTSQRSWLDHLQEKRWWSAKIAADFKKAVSKCNSIRGKVLP